MNHSRYAKTVATDVPMLDITPKPILGALPIPTLTGSPKQVKWANKVRRGFMQLVALRCKSFEQSKRDAIVVASTHMMNDKKHVIELDNFISSDMTTAQAWIALSLSNGALDHLVQYVSRDSER